MDQLTNGRRPMPLGLDIKGISEPLRSVYIMKRLKDGQPMGLHENDAPGLQHENEERFTGRLEGFLYSGVMSNAEKIRTLEDDYRLIRQDIAALRVIIGKGAMAIGLIAALVPILTQWFIFHEQPLKAPASDAAELRGKPSVEGYTALYER